VLYFCIIEMILIKWMYNTSLQQFLSVFDYAIEIAEKGTTIERVQNIINSATYQVYYTVNRGLYEADKTTFLLLIVFKVLITDKKLSNNDVSIYLKGGGDLDSKSEKQPPSYLESAQWMNAIKLSRHKFGRETHCFFAELPDTLQRHDKEWQEWLNRNDPEVSAVPCEFQEKIDNNKDIGIFMKLCLVRALRTDRTKIASRVFIKSSLGAAFIDPVSYPISSIYEISKKSEPVLYLVTAGGDPTAIIDDCSKKNKVPYFEAVSMGQGQERNARNAVTKAMVEGGWALLQNCHLGLGYMQELTELLTSDAVLDFHEDGRIWLTVEQSDSFPLYLLQNSIKITNEPPKGIKAGLYKTFTSTITQEFLERVEHENWKTMIYVMAFLHSVVLERRKFGPLGWCIPYQFNYSDLEATLMYFEHDLNEIISKLTLSQAANTLNLKWYRLQYMVCEVQYGGRITDDLDKELFTVYGKELYIRETILLSQPYSIIDKTLPAPKGARKEEKKKLLYQTPNNIRECEIPHFLEHIKQLPDEDNPECFGLNQDADLAFQLKETFEMLDVLLEIRPKEGGGGEGKSVDEQVKDTVNDFLSKMPPIYDVR
jgi:dynein heavy chain